MSLVVAFRNPRKNVNHDITVIKINKDRYTYDLLNYRYSIPLWNHAEVVKEIAPLKYAR